MTPIVLDRVPSPDTTDGTTVVIGVDELLYLPRMERELIEAVRELRQTRKHCRILIEFDRDGTWRLMEARPFQVIRPMGQN